MKKSIFVAALAASVTLASLPAQAREQISIVGSSTVYPFATVVAERFGRATGSPTPTIESTGSGGGLNLFCSGVGVNTADITNSSSYIKESQYQACKEKGIDFFEVKVGYDGIVMAQSNQGTQFELTLKEVFLALAKTVPTGTDGEVQPNPYQTWNQINPKFPNTPIRVIGPPPTSGTRVAFVELVMDEGCKEFGWLKSLESSDRGKFREICRTMREDGGFVEGGENDNLIVQRIRSDAGAVGVFGFSYLEENRNVLSGIPLNGVTPDFENIADGSYPVARPLHMFVKKAHIGVVPGIMEYVNTFLSPAAQSMNGYLAERGLIPLGADELRQIRADVAAQKSFTM